MGIRKAQTHHISYQACDSLKYLMEKSTLKHTLQQVFELLDKSLSRSQFGRKIEQI